MPQGPDIPPISVLLVDSSKKQRTYWADQLKSCSPDYQIIEADDGPSGLNIYWSRRIDCVVLEISLPDGESGFETIIGLMPLARKSRVAVIVLTLITNQGVWKLAKKNGAYACLAKDFTTGEDLHNAIQRAIAFVGQMPEGD